MSAEAPRAPSETSSLMVADISAVPVMRDTSPAKASTDAKCDAALLPPSHFFTGIVGHTCGNPKHDPEEELLSRC